MFDRMLWQDNVRDPARTYKATQNADGTVTMEPAGKLMQQGTNQSAENFNRMEEAIQDSQIAQQIIFQHQLQFEADHEERVSGLEAENIVETGTVTLTNTLKYPFNNSDTLYSSIGAFELSFLTGVIDESLMTFHLRFFWSLMMRV